LWTQQQASYSSGELTFDGIHQMPKPVQPGGIPLWISGTVNNAVARRIARFGSGWIPWGPAYADMPAAIAAMKDKVREFGGDPTDLQVQGVGRTVRKHDGSIDVAASVADVPALVDAGVTDIRFPASPRTDPDHAVEVFTSLVEAFRAVTR
jgi:hypothetical protein